MEYDFDQHNLYFCNYGNDSINGAAITYNSDGTLSAGNIYLLLSNVNCADLKLDKFGNLFFVDRG